VTGDGLDALFRCEALTALTDLHLTGAPLTAQLVRVFANNPCFAGLKTLCIGQSNFDDRMAEELAASPYLRNLRVIDLQNNILGAQGMSALARSPVLDTVTSLELHNSGDFSDAGAIALAGSEHAQNLRRLSVVSTGLGLEGLRAIANSPHLAQLRSLNVENTRFGDKGARALCDSPYFQKIRELRVNDCGISDQMKAALRKRFGSSVTL
jgi:Ran GTPase-activating protein (RanGAP) involved in mRNA processing and transport